MLINHNYFSACAEGIQLWSWLNIIEGFYFPPPRGSLPLSIPPSFAIPISPSHPSFLSPLFSFLFSLILLPPFRFLLHARFLIYISYFPTSVLPFFLPSFLQVFSFFFLSPLFTLFAFSSPRFSYIISAPVFAHLFLSFTIPSSPFLLSSMNSSHTWQAFKASTK